MTENEPIRRDDSSKGRLGAGEVGVHRSPVTEPLVDPGYSRNIAPLRFWGFEIAQERYTGRELIPEEDEQEARARAETPAAGGPARETGGPAAPGTAGAPEAGTGGHHRRKGSLLAGLAVLVLVLRRMRRARRRRAVPRGR